MLFDVWHNSVWRLQRALRVAPPPILRRLQRARYRPVDAATRLRLQTLTERYDLSRWTRYLDTAEYQENLYTLDNLDLTLGPGPVNVNSALEIGCKNFSLLPALSAYAPGPWLGVELQAYQRYRDMSTRRSHGEFFCQIFTTHGHTCRYYAGNALDVTESQDLIVWILPFLTSQTQRHGRLPQRFFQPRALLQHAWSRLKPGGRLWIVNQNAEEAALQQRLFADCKIDIDRRHTLASRFSPFRNQRVGWLLRKTPVSGSSFKH